MRPRRRRTEVQRGTTQQQLRCRSRSSAICTPIFRPGILPGAQLRRQPLLGYPRSVRQIQLSRMSAIRPSAHSGEIVLDGLMAEMDRTEFRSMEVLIDSAGGRFISAESWIPPRKTNLRGSGAPASPLLTHLTNPRRPCTKCSDASPCRENSHDVDGKNTEIR